MKRIMVQYKVKPDKSWDNINLIKNVFAELKLNSPVGLRYVSFVLPDGVSFIHIASVESDDGKNPLSESKAFAEFQMQIQDRCEIQPRVNELKEIDSYNFYKPR